jgi:hypothetical protein
MSARRQDTRSEPRRAFARPVGWFATGALVLCMTLAWSTPSDAQVTGGCTASIDGKDADAARSVRSAIAVSESSKPVVRGTAPGPIDTYKVYLDFAGINIPAGEGTVDDGSNTYSESVNVDDYAVYGVGLYRVEGETTGTPCSAWGYVKVTGRFPLATVAGAVGAVLAVAGLIGLVLSWPRRPRTMGGT